MIYLAFIFALEAGFSSESELMFSAPGWDGGSLQAAYQIESPYVQWEAAAELFGFLQIGGSVRVYFADVDGWSYAPYDARLPFWVKASRWGFTAGWEHECIHPHQSPDRPDVGFLLGGGDRIYLRYDGKIPVRRNRRR